MTSVLCTGAVDTHEQSGLHYAEVGEDVNLVDEPMLVLLNVCFEVEVDVVDCVGRRQVILIDEIDSVGVLLTENALAWGVLHSLHKVYAVDLAAVSRH